jgi:hypothetical protein
MRNLLRFAFARNLAIAAAAALVLSPLAPELARATQRLRDPIITQGVGTADPLLRFLVGRDVTNFSLGLDNSASDTFVIAGASTLGTAATDYFKIATNGALTFGGGSGVQDHAMRGSMSATLSSTSTREFSFTNSNAGANAGAQFRVYADATNHSALFGHTTAANAGTGLLQADRAYLYSNTTTAGGLALGAGLGAISFYSGGIASTELNGSIDGNGLWTIGESGGSQTHVVNGSGTVSQTWLVGDTSASGNNLLEVGSLSSTANAILSGTTQNAIQAELTVNSSATSRAAGIQASYRTPVSAFTLGAGYGVRVGTPTIGAGSTVTRNIGLGFQGVGTSGTNNAFIADNEAFTGNYFINSTSTNSSHIAGSLGLGANAGAPSFPLHVRVDQNTTTAGAIYNANTGSSARSSLLLSNNDTTGEVTYFSTGAGALSGTAIASGMRVQSPGAGGLNIAATHASGALRFFSGGTTQVGGVDSTGAWTVGAGSTTASHTVNGDLSVSGDVTIGAGAAAANSQIAVIANSTSADTGNITAGNSLTITLASATTAGMLLATDVGSGNVAIFLISISGGNYVTFLISDPGSVYSATDGAASRISISKSGTSLKVNNQTASTARVRLTYLKGL